MILLSQPFPVLLLPQRHSGYGSLLASPAISCQSFCSPVFLDLLLAPSFPHVTPIFGSHSPPRSHLTLSFLPDSSCWQSRKAFSPFGLPPEERETETLNRARQLVFSSDNMLAQGTHHLGCQGIPHGGYHHQSSNIGDPTLQYRSIYPTRLFSGTSTNTLVPTPPPAGQPPPVQPYVYASPPRLQVSFPSSHYPVNDYFVGHVLPTTQSSPSYASAAPPETSYTCIGAPVGHGVLPSGRGSSEGVPGGGVAVRDMSLYSNASPINRFQDGF
nr:zinc finger protein JAGGED-like [Ipomoea batatas]